MRTEPHLYKLGDDNKIHKDEVKRLIENKLKPNVFFDVNHVIDFEKYKADNKAYLVLSWFVFLAGIIQYKGETRFIISEYQSPAKDDTEQINYCIVLGMANFLMDIEERTGIDVRPIIPDLDKPKMAAISADILLQLRRKG